MPGKYGGNTFIKYFLPRRLLFLRFPRSLHGVVTDTFSVAVVAIVGGIFYTLDPCETLRGGTPPTG